MIKILLLHERRAARPNNQYLMKNLMQRGDSVECLGTEGNETRDLWR
jgi:hypothetical protein